MTVTMSHRTWSVTSHKRVSRRATVVALRLPSPPERRVLRRVVLCATGDFQVRLVSSRKAGLRIADFVRHDTPDVNQDYRSDDRRGDAKEPRNCFPAACRGAGSFEGFNHWYEHGDEAQKAQACHGDGLQYPEGTVTRAIPKQVDEHQVGDPRKHLEERLAELERPLADLLPFCSAYLCGSLSETYKELTRRFSASFKRWIPA